MPARVDDELFRVASACLERRGLPYWVDSGTLLGLVRDGALIPWDEDLDFGAMHPDVSEADIRAAFDPRDFSVHSLLPSRGVHGCHVFPRDPRLSGKVDICFYQRQGARAVHTTNAAPESEWTRLLGLLECFFDVDYRPARRSRRMLQRGYHQWLAPHLPAPARRGGRQLLDALCRRNCAAGKQLIYDFPACYFERLARTSFLGVEVNVPALTLEYLQTAYGADWRTPRRYQRWYDGATSVLG